MKNWCSMRLNATLTGILTFAIAGSSFLTAVEAPYLTANTVDAVTLLPPPVALESAEAASELGVVLLAQQQRTPADLARIASEDHMGLENFAEAIGPWCSPDKLPQLKALIQEIQSESKVIVYPAKAHFSHPRPPAVDPRVHPVVTEASDSYPSGHATRGMMDAEILAELFPERKDPIMKRGQEIGWDRVVAGVHFPSDIVAGRVLGQALAKALLAQPSFQQRLITIRSEISLVRTSH
jgi:acid phosphatase (class A)